MLGHLSVQQIESLLQNNVLGRIGCTNGTEVYVVPVSYVYDGNSIIAHSREGLKINMMRRHPLICFEVEDVQDMMNWETVVVQGKFEELMGEEDKFYAMKKLVDRMLKLKLSDTAKPPHLSENRVHTHQPGDFRAVVFRVHIIEKTGRFEKQEGQG